jgi:N-acetyl-anhydromuramoyl-L-alanine amidase
MAIEAYKATKAHGANKATGWLSSMRLPDGGLLGAVHRRESPNFDERPKSVKPNLLVLHYISLPANVFSGGHVEDFFLNRLDTAAHESFTQLSDIKVSAHFFLRRNGQLMQFVDCDKRAWHAGVSNFLGTERCNDFSIGVEIEGSSDYSYTKKQYQRLAKLTKLLCMFYPLKHVAGHSDIAPGRKQDPGPHFDWLNFLKSVENTGLTRPF